MFVIEGIVVDKISYLQLLRGRENYSFNSKSFGLFSTSEALVGEEVFSNPFFKI